jgi:hypothetical protein
MLLVSCGRSCDAPRICRGVRPAQRVVAGRIAMEMAGDDTTHPRRFARADLGGARRLLAHQCGLHDVAAHGRGLAGVEAPRWLSCDPSSEATRK